MLPQPQSKLSSWPGVNTEAPGWTGRHMKEALARTGPGMPVSLPGHALERLIPVCQGCTGSTSITCVHSAVARNSLTYLTALETPDRSQTDTQVKAQVKTVSQPTGMQQRTPRGSRSLALSTGPETKGSKSRGSCKALLGLHTQVSVTLPAQTSRACTTAFREGLKMGSPTKSQNPGE